MLSGVEQESKWVVCENKIPACLVVNTSSVHLLAQFNTVKCTVLVGGSASTALAGDYNAPVRTPAQAQSFNLPLFLSASFEAALYQHYLFRSTLLRFFNPLCARFSLGPTLLLAVGLAACFQFIPPPTLDSYPNYPDPLSNAA